MLIPAIVAVFSTCTKEPDVNTLATGDFGETATPLKDAADFPIGVAFSPTLFNTNQTYSNIVKTVFDGVTYEYLMKHGAIVKDNGDLDYSKADALIPGLGSLQIFGHTLGWHQNQNATYVKNFAGITVPAAVELVNNAGMENGTGTTPPPGFNVFNTGAAGNPPAEVSATTASAEVRTGTRALKVMNPVAYGTSQWRVQLGTDFFPTVSGKVYSVALYIRSAGAGGDIRLSSQNTTAGGENYGGDTPIPTAWTLMSWSFTASSASTRLMFDMGKAANTYFIDDVSVKELIQAPSGAQVVAKVDQALENFITNTVNHYKAKVKAWDVINEILTDDGKIRNNANTMPPSNVPADMFVWSEYLGKDFALKAFNYAKAADATADLYINDYSLETRPVKLDSLIKLVADLKTAGAKIDGIGTQMHISWNTSYDGIDQMFKKLGATGLKIRVSELDVKTVLGSAAGKPTPQLLSYQAEKVKYVVSSYMKHIPKAQQAGITIWGVNDASSWLSNNGKEYALFFDDAFQPKPSYGAFLQALQGK